MCGKLNLWSYGLDQQQQQRGAAPPHLDIDGGGAPQAAPKQQQPAPPRTRNSDVSPEVSHLIERMMLKDASLRYATPEEVISVLRRFFVLYSCTVIP